MELVLNKEQLNLLQSKTKFYTYFSSFEKVSFKITDGNMELLSKGNSGLLRVSIPVDYKGEDVCISLELSKWLNALSKFVSAPELSLNITNKLLKLQIPGTSDVINLGINKFSADSTEAVTFDTDFDEQKNNIVSKDCKLTLTDKIVSDLQVASSLLLSNTGINAIGLSKEGVMYADRRIIFKTYFKNNLDENLFKLLDDGEDCFFIHSATVSFFNLINKDAQDVYFGDGYDILYWADESNNVEVVLVQPARELSLPTAEDIEAITPQTTEANMFKVNALELKNDLDFFNGFFEGSNWKTLTFDLSENGVTFKYKQAMADLTKKVVCGETDIKYPISFDIIDIDSIKKPVGKAKNDTDITFYADEESVGIECLIGDEYRVVYAKAQQD